MSVFYSSISSRIRTLLVTQKTLVLYFCIGASASLLDLGAFFFFYSVVEVPSPLATTYSVSLATAYAFFLNAFFNFKMTDHFFWRFLSYVTVSGIGLLISASLLLVFNVYFGLDGNIVKIITLPIIFLVQYFLNKKVTFQGRVTKEA